jgi:hypothetical protein
MPPADPQLAAPALPPRRARRALGYVVDAGPVWVAQLGGVAHLLAQLAPLHLFGAAILDPTTGKPVPPEDLPEAADLALHWVPGLCVWALTQALSIDLLGVSMGAVAAGLAVHRGSGQTAGRPRLLARELLRVAPAAIALTVAGLLTAFDAPSASFWALVAGLLLALATFAVNAARVALGGRTLLDALVDVRVFRAGAQAPREAIAPAS